MAEPDRTLVVDVFADIVCPWCYIGDRRLHRALDTLQTEHPDLAVEVRWRPFQLQPEMPADGLPWDDFAEQTFGGQDRARASYRYVERASQSDAVDFRFDAIDRAPNTVDAHRLILFAQTRGRTTEVVEALFRAYFSEGRDLNDLDTLAEIGAAQGLDRDIVRGFLASDIGREEVAASQETAEQMGISGVPFYIIDRRYAFSGAQPEHVFHEALTLALSPESEES